jgi:hypothetical protein
MIDGKVYAIQRARAEAAHARQTSSLVSENAVRESQLNSQLSAERLENATARTDIALLKDENAELREFVSRMLDILAARAPLSVSMADVDSWRTQMNAIPSGRGMMPKKRRKRT